MASTLNGVFHLGVSGKSAFFDKIHEYFPDEFIFECREANEDAIAMLKEYFAHERESFGPKPPLIDFRDASEFELAVWQETMQIPFGTTATYKQIAENLGDASSARAVGGALGRNRVPIFIPCHRVISSDGSLGGFSAGLELKRALLEFEGVALKESD